LSHDRATANPTRHPPFSSIIPSTRFGREGDTALAFCIEAFGGAWCARGVQRPFFLHAFHAEMSHFTVCLIQ